MPAFNLVIMDKRIRKTSSGFTIAELLMALAVTVMILTAVALALNASVINYTRNDQVFKAISRGQQSLLRITNQLRTASAVDPDAAANECAMVTAEGDDITYRYDSTDDILYLVTNDNLADDDYVLCGDVTGMTFQKQTAVVGGVTFVKSVCISMMIDAGGAGQPLSAAAVIQKNLD